MSKPHKLVRVCGASDTKLKSGRRCKRSRRGARGESAHKHMKEFMSCSDEAEIENSISKSKMKLITTCIWSKCPETKKILE